MQLNTSIISVVLIVGLSAVMLSDAADKDLFKINKLNIIFNKAQHSLGSSKLKNLQSDLKMHEHDELNLKKMKSQNQDKDGLFEASVRKKLLTILKKYSLERYHDDIHSMGPKDDAKLSTKPVETPSFRDSKLDKLWKKAEKAGFNQEQLMILHEEFQHQQDKLDEHYRASNLVAEELEKSAEEYDKLKNSIERFEPELRDTKKSNLKQHKEPAKKDEHVGKNLQQALKEKHKGAKKGYEPLQEKIRSGIVDPDEPFEENQVNDLWSIASKSNFTEDELQSLKEELEHYQTRVQKLKHFQNQLERQRIGVKDYSSNADEDDESKHIRKKVDELSHKIQKAHKALVGKIIKDEL